jgi:hypothetical protein
MEEKYNIKCSKISGLLEYLVNFKGENSGSTRNDGHYYKRRDKPDQHMLLPGSPPARKYELPAARQLFPTIHSPN